MKLIKNPIILSAIFFSLFSLAGIIYLISKYYLPASLPATKNQTQLVAQLPSNDGVVGISPQPTVAAKPIKRDITIVAVGDIMLSRTVDAKMREQNDYHFPFASTTDWLRDADITFANLETAITPGEPVRPMKMYFRADPRVAAVLAEVGFDIVGLANNHSPNFGEPGLKDTFNYLDKAGIIYAGAGQNLDQARAAKFIQVRDTTIAWLAYNDSDVVPPYYGAGDNRAGTNLMNIDQLKIDITAIRSEADFIIVSMHSGSEYVFTPNQRQINFARAAIDAGADLIIGHHPHVVESAEVYKGKYIFYSLGNFIFDQMWSEPTREGLMLKFFISPRQDSAGTESQVTKIIAQPVLIENYSQPQIIAGDRADKIIDRLQLEFEKNESGEYIIIK